SRCSPPTPRSRRPERGGYFGFFFAGFFGPSETVMVILVPLGTVRPAFGARALTWFFFTFEEISWICLPRTQPFLRNASLAWGIVMPSVRGTTQGRVRLVCTAAADAV